MLFNALSVSLTPVLAERVNLLEQYVQIILPYIIAVLEILGIVIVVWSAIKAFIEFLQNTFLKKNNYVQYNFAVGLATGLTFKMAAEILNTVLVKTFDELLILGAVILLRAVLSVLIHFEVKKHDKSQEK